MSRYPRTNVTLTVAIRRLQQEGANPLLIAELNDLLDRVVEALGKGPGGGDVVEGGLSA